MLHRLLPILIFAIGFATSGYASPNPQNDAGLVIIQMDDYGLLGEYKVRGVFKNEGTDNLSSVIINWQIDGGSIQRYNKDNFDIRPGQSWPFLHPDKVNINEPGKYIIKIWVSTPNGEEDQNPANDTLSHSIQVLESFPEKNFLIEEITGAWCGYCPRAPIIFEKRVKPYYQNALMVAVHTGDAMSTNTSSQVMSTYVSGVPCGFVNRVKVTGGTVDLAPELWKTTLDKLDPDFTPAALNVYSYYYPDTRELKIDVVADFVLDYNGDLRLNCYVIEDGLTGEGRQWDQRNFFNASASEPYMELQGAGDPIPGYVHNHVVREMLAGSWGEPGIIPNQVSAGDRYVYSKTIVLPQNWTVENLHLIGIIQCYHADDINQRPILNAMPAEIQLATGEKVWPIEDLVTIYPNPVTQDAVITLSQKTPLNKSIRIFNTLGQIMNHFTLEPGTSQLIKKADYPAGLYYYTVFGEENVIQSGKLIIR